LNVDQSLFKIIYPKLLEKKYGKIRYYNWLDKAMVLFGKTGRKEWKKYAENQLFSNCSFIQRIL